ncbi:MAG TPA: EAL domain-containing protein [Candidatus Brocadiaceae bacterium]
MNENSERNEIKTARRTIKFFDKLLRASADGIVITDGGHNIIVANEAFCQFFGRQWRDVVETNLFYWLDQLGKDAAKRWAELENRIHSGGAYHNIEFALPKTDGDKHLSVNVSLLEKVDIEEEGVMVSIWRDITDQKKTEELMERIRLTTFVKDVGIALAKGDNVREILCQCMEAVVNNLDAACARIWLLNDKENMLELQASAGIHIYKEGFTNQIPVGKFRIGLIAQDRKPYITNSIIGDTHICDSDWARKEGIAAFAGYPLIIENRLIGVMVIFARKPLAEFTLKVLSSASDILSLGVNNKRGAEALRMSEERFRLLLDSTAEGIYGTDSQGNCTFANLACVDLLGYRDARDLIGKNMHTTIHHTGVDGAPYSLEECPIYESYRYGKSNHVDDEVFWRADGTRFPVEYWSHPMNQNGVRVGSVITFVDITERKRAEDEIRYVAHHDALTDLPNRILFNDRLTLALAHAHRNKELMAVMFLDLDRFKMINDTLGHTAGDQLLREVAHKLRKCVREDDTIARLGGDEFSLLLPGITHIEHITQITEKILNVFVKPWNICGYELYITASIGIALYPYDGESVEILLKNADIAMYHAKEQGRNNYQFYNPAMHTKYFEKMLMENAMRRALECKDFVVHYQPQINIVDGMIVGIEALVRWQHPEKGLILPDDFLVLAEDTRLIVSIDELVLNTVCEQIKTWQDTGFKPTCVAVNLSAHTFQQRNLVEMITSVLKEADIKPHLLGLEITEGIAMKDMETTIHKLSRLNKMGIKIAIDDFGTGFSSLTYLKKFPISKIKICKNFVHGIVNDEKDRVIVASIIALARGLKFRVIAEGVETESQLNYLRNMKCDEVQGRFFCEPLSPDAFEKIMMQDRVCVNRR